MTSTRKQIQEDFNKVISYSQGLACPNTGPLFDQWYESKKDFISAFNLIWESKTPVVRCLSLSMNHNTIMIHCHHSHNLQGHTQVTR